MLNEIIVILNRNYFELIVWGIINILPGIYLYIKIINFDIVILILI